jgi:RraA family protein
MSATGPVSSDLHPGVGFRVRSRIDRPAAELVARLREFGTADISDQLNRLYALSSDIRMLAGGDTRLVGPALTVRVFPGDNLMVHACLDLAQPGDVVVVDADASSANAVLGGTICSKAKARRIAGFVVDGLIRDLPEIQALGMPVFARGTTPIGPLHRGPGEINHPVCCGQRVVSPGDVVVGDATGLVVVPSDGVEETCRRLSDGRSGREAYAARVRRGEFSNQWAHELLAKSGCRFEDR